MKLIKKILLSLALPVGLIVIAGCSHNHSLTGGYHYDETNHWRECFECDEKFNVTAHEFSSWKVNDDKTLEERVCECGYSETKEYVNPHQTHSFTNYVSNNDATCTKNGTETAICDGCNKTDTRVIKDSKIEHTFTKYEGNNDETCTSNETETATCDYCDAINTREIPDSKESHSFTKYVSNNNPTCSSNCTETAKCDNCDATNTRDIKGTKLEHIYGELIPFVEGSCTVEEVLAHYQCSSCEHYFTEEKVEVSYEEINKGYQHTYGEWVTTEPTFDEDGSRYRVCSCTAREDEVLPKLIKVEEFEISTSANKIIEGQEIELKVDILTEGADNYDVKWISSNENIIKVVYKNGKYYAVAQHIDSSVTSLKTTLTATVTNVLGEVEYESYDDSMEVSVINPIVEYNFNDAKIVNTGTNQTVTGKVTTMSGNNVVDSTASIEYGKDSNDLDNNSIKLGQKKEGGNHFTINGIDLGTNDFTIMARMNISGAVTNSNSSCYLLGIGNPTDELGNIKDVKAPYFNISYKLDGEKNRVRFVINSKVNEKNSEGSLVYLPYGEWIEVMVIRSGNNVSLVITEVDSGTSSGYEIVLPNAETINFTSNCNLGFTGNSGCQNGAPSNYTYYDDIQVYDFAIDKEGSLIKHTYGEYVDDNNATCVTNATQSATCTICNSKIIKEIPNSTVAHNYGTLVEAKVPTNCVDTGNLAHYQCSECKKYFTEEKVETTLENITIYAGHDYKDWEYVSYPTFDQAGERSRGCYDCDHIETETLEKLTKVEEIEISNTIEKVIEESSTELKVDILVEGKTSYKVEWTSSDKAVIEVVYQDGKYYAVSKTLSNSVTSAKATLTVKVTNVLGETEYESVTDSFEITVVNPIVEYTFNNGTIANTGTNQTVTGKVTTMSGTNVVDSTASIVYGKDSNDLENNAIKLDQKKEGGNHFTINGIDLGTNDFTIMARMNISGLVTNSNSSCYLLGIGNPTDANGNVKDVKSPYFNVSYKLADGQNRVRFVIDSTLNEKNSENSYVYLPYGEWIDVMIVRNDNNVKFTITEVDSGLTTGYEITLSSAEAINFTSSCNLAFTGNSGCQNGAPSNYTYYDDIQVYDFAIN